MDLYLKKKRLIFTKNKTATPMARAWPALHREAQKGGDFFLVAWVELTVRNPSWCEWVQAEPGRRGSNSIEFLAHGLHILFIGASSSLCAAVQRESPLWLGAMDMLWVGSRCRRWTPWIHQYTLRSWGMELDPSVVSSTASRGIWYGQRLQIHVVAVNVRTR